MAAFRKFRRKFLPFLPNGVQIRRIRSQILRRFGLARTHDPWLLVRQPELRIANLLRYVAADLAVRNEEIAFLQIGAFDGVTDDDLREVIANYPVRGILVEPQPAVFKRLEERYGDHPRLTLVNAAVDRTSGSRAFYTTRDQLSTMASFSRQHLRKHRIPSREITAQRVECLSIPDLMTRCGFDSIDLLQIDAEGYDYEIIKSLDFDQTRPSVIRFEFAHFSRREIDECLRTLSDRGYRFLVENKDVIAVQPTVSTAPSRLQAAAA